MFTSKFTPFKIFWGFLLFLASSTVLAQSKGQPFEILQQQIDDLTTGFQQQIDDLKAEVLPQNQFVDCNAGQSVQDAVSSTTRSSHWVTIFISGICTESVIISRTKTRLIGVTPGDGLQDPSHSSPVLRLSGARVILFGISLYGGETALSVGPMSLVEGFNIDIDGFSGARTGVQVSGSSTAWFNNLNIKNTQSGIGVDGGGVFGVRGFSIADSSDSGARVDGGRLDLSNGTITNSGEAGVWVFGGSQAQISDVVVDNTDNAGIWVQGGSGAQIQSTVVKNADFVGLNVRDNSNAWMTGNVTIGPGSEIGAMITNNSNAAFVDTTITGNTDIGLLLMFGSSATMNNGSVDNTGGDGINIAHTSIVEIDGTDIMDNSGKAIDCQDPPAAAHLSGTPGTISGNFDDTISCPFYY